jgi:hypothetical protein
MLPTYPYETCQHDIVSASADTVFGHAANMSADMSATCRADTHVSVNSTIFSTFENPTFPAKAVGRRCWQRKMAVAGTKTRAETAMVGDTVNNQLKGVVEETTAAAMVTAAETATATKTVMI